MFSETAERLNIDADRVLLFGHSNGAIYAQLLLNSSLGPWSAAALHGGYAGTNHQIAPMEAKPLRFYLGLQDRIFITPGARASGHALAANGHQVELIKISQHTHWFYEIGPKKADDSWDWFEAVSGLTKPVPSNREPAIN